MTLLSSNTEHLGDEPGIRLILSAPASAYALYGMVAFFRSERPGERRCDP
jgi:hypothetical protein